MARSGGRSSGGSRRSAPAPSRQAPPPARAPAPAAGGMQQQQPSMLGGLGGMVMQGMAWGTGTAIARTAVDSVMGGGRQQEAPQQQFQAPAVQEQQQGGVCSFDQQQFLRCLNENPSNSGSCDFYYNALQQCQMNAK